jgi:hypothetical protein
MFWFGGYALLKRVAILLDSPVWRMMVVSVNIITYI